MTDDRRQHIEQIYLDALDLPAVDRPGFLDRACEGDFALRSEAEALLALQSGAEGFLEQPAIESAARTLADILPALRPPEIPGYQILRHLGEGGMGLVYLAEQKAPLRRHVALKVIKPGMDSRQVVARFNAERQALAQMDHPNIAAVHDAGTTADGRPYFVMEFVDGPPISEYCDRKGLTTSQRLELFTQVCAGVQHAHQKGVIHRDLKPSNVLVTERDGRPMPKVIDFGTAKAIARSWEGGVETLTAYGMVLGTIEYMSPEQAAFSRDIDTTTDVYSLGVVLYELLVGVLPFERPRPGPEGYDELRRLIRENDPPRPSTRLSTIGGRAGIASARQTDPARLRRSLQGDLDWITLKALEKDRTRRYPTVAALSSDIRRFLLDQTVDARQPSTWYRIRKFTRRHSGAVTAAASLFVMLVAGIGYSRWQYVRAEHALAQLKRLYAQAEYERSRADLARAKEAEATAEANNRRIDAEQQELRATQEYERGVAALELADYNNYVITIAAADGAIRTSRYSNARDRLGTVLPARRGWEWHHLMLRAGRPLTDEYAELLDSRLAQAQKRLAALPPERRGPEWEYLARQFDRLSLGGEKTALNVAVDGATVMPPPSGVTKLEASTPALATSVAMSVDGRSVVWGSTYGSLTVWHPDQRREVVVRSAPEGRSAVGLAVAVVVPFADNRTILTGLGTEGSLMTWDVETRQSVSLPTMDRAEPGCTKSGVWRAAVSPNDRYLAILQGNCVIIRDLATTGTLAVLRVDRHGFYNSSASFVAFLSDESILVTARHHNGVPPFPAGFNSVRRWDWRTNHVKGDRLLPMATARPLAVATSKDGRRIALAAGELVTVWDSTLAREIGRIVLPRTLDGNLALALSPDGSRLATAWSDQRSVLLWDPTRGQQLLTLVDDDVAMFLGFTQSGQLIATNPSGGITIWESRPQSCVTCPKAPAQRE